MKKVCLLLFLYTFLLSSLKGQIIQFKNQTDTIGYRIKDNKEPILAEKYSFSHKILGMKYDSLKNHYSVIFNGLPNTEKTNKVFLGIFNPIKNDLKWYKEINLKTQDLSFSNNFLVLSLRNKNFGIDTETGEELWEVDNPLLFSFYDANVGITYKNKLFRKNDGLYGIDLLTGNMVWERDDLSFKKGLSRKYIYRDTSLIFLNNKINSINVKTGKGWSYDIPVARECADFNYQGNCFLTSNFFRDSTSFVIATVDRLLRMSYQGNVISETFFPTDIECSESILFHKKDSFYLFNLGYSLLGGYYRMKQKKPFIARFNNDGSIKYINQLEQKGLIENYYFDRDTLIIMHKRAISKYSLENGEMIMSKEMEKKELREWNGFVKNSVYIQTSASTYKTLYEIDSTKYYVYNDEFTITVLDHNFNKQGEYLKNSYYKISDKYLDWTFINNNDITIVIDKDGKKVAEIPKTNNIEINGKYMYFSSDRFIYKTEVTNITK